MSIVLKTSPVSPPVSDSDWQYTQDLITLQFLGSNGSIARVIGTNIVKGSVFQIGGAIYYAESDTAITGTPSDYVKITHSGSSATASYVSSLSGVTWNDTYNGYYDGSGYLYVFDEETALLNGTITTPHISTGNLFNTIKDGWNRNVTFGSIKTDNVSMQHKTIPIGTWNMNSASSITVAHGIGDADKILLIRGYIVSDVNTDRVFPIELADGTTSNVSGGYGTITDTQITVIAASLYKASSDFSSTLINRGKLFVIYEI